LRTLFIFAWLIGGSISLAADSAKSCVQRPEYRRFDFWVGEWDVEVGGKIVAKSSIQSIADGCIILENWMPFGGGEGKSWNFYNSATGEWEQVWVTGMGEILKVAGGWKNGAMREEGPTRSATGKPALHRHSFTPVTPNRVRQFCEESEDGGKTWHVAFDGLYIPAKPKS